MRTMYTYDHRDVYKGLAAPQPPFIHWDAVESYEDDYLAWDASEWMPSEIVVRGAWPAMGADAAPHGWGVVMYASWSDQFEHWIDGGGTFLDE